MTAVSFDFGQTLAELDFDFLRRRLRERALDLDPERARAASIEAWARYGTLKAKGHAVAWRAMIQLMLARGGIPETRLDEVSAWLWDEQPRQNLWRKPIPGMIELARELRQSGVRVAVLSNSEGYLVELVAELGWTRDFDAVVDSGRVGVDKPDPRIFRVASEQLGVETGDLLHVGDSWEADVVGALGVNGRAVWFHAQHAQRSLPSGVFGAADAAELREVLAGLTLVS